MRGGPVTPFRRKTMSTAPAPRSTRPASTAPPQRRMSLADIQTKGKNLPSRLVMHGVGGIGKTSFAAYAPKPVFLMSRLETGIESLKDFGLVPDHVGFFPECQVWNDVLAALDTLTNEQHDYKTFVVDVLNGLERMCHEHVCSRDYGGKWTSFTAYGAGNKVAIADWRQFLSALDKLRETKKMMMVLLAHTKVRNFKNPEGPDYDRYMPDMSEETWNVTYGWADLVLFANYYTAVKEEGRGKAKGAGGDERLLHTSRTAAWDAKHRHGLPEEIEMGKTGHEAWTNFA